MGDAVSPRKRMEVSAKRMPPSMSWVIKGGGRLLPQRHGALYPQPKMPLLIRTGS